MASKVSSLFVWLLVPLVLRKTTVLPRAAAQEMAEAGEVTTVTVSANAFDERTDATAGCPPDGCAAENTRDGDLADVSRWSCSGELVAAGGGAAGEECQIVYGFAEGQLVHSVAIAFLKGDERMRGLNVNVNGALHTVVESGGTSTGLETFEIDAQDVLSLGLESTGLTAGEYISIKEVEFQVSSVAVSPATAAPPTPVPVAATSAPVVIVASPPTVAPLTTAATLAPAAVVASPPSVAPWVTAATPAPVATVAAPTAAPPPSPLREVATPSPAPLSSLSRGLELTPSPSLGGDIPTTESGITTSTDVCLDCYEDEECRECIGSENETEYDQCMEQSSAENACDAIWATWCCRAEASGNDCMANQAYVDFLTCVQPFDAITGDIVCPIDDADCSGFIGLGTAGNSAAFAVSVSYLTAILTSALGLAAAAAAAAVAVVAG